MITVNPYLYFKGDCEEAFNFYKSVFEVEFKYIGRYKDVPQAEKHIFHEQDNKIMHVSLPISNQITLMGADNTEVHKGNISNNNFSLSITSDSKKEADKLFQKLSEGGKIKLHSGVHIMELLMINLVLTGRLVLKQIKVLYLFLNV